MKSTGKVMQSTSQKCETTLHGPHWAVES